MRLEAPDGRSIWLAYGMNVHPGGTLASFSAALDDVVAPLRARLGIPGPFGLAVRFSAAGLAAASGEEIEALGRRLTAEQFVPFTGNAFVLGDFAGRPLKDEVYRPPWSDPARRAYTLRFADLLGAWSSGHASGPLTLSTAPGSWRGWQEGPEAEQVRAREIAATAADLHARAADGGMEVHLGLEPEPGCTIETTDELIDFFTGPLAAALDEHPAGAAAHVGVCYDVCHQAVLHEDAHAALGRIRAAGIPVVKLQASCALELRDPHDGAGRAALARFDEPIYLHQLAAPDAAGRVHVAPDLGDVLADASGTWTARRPWRVHFHVPVFRDEAIPPLGTTRPELVRALEAVVAQDLTRHIEIETYTWDVLPDAERAAGSGGDLVAGLAREYEAVLEILAASGVRPA